MGPVFHSTVAIRVLGDYRAAPIVFGGAAGLPWPYDCDALWGQFLLKKAAGLSGGNRRPA
jgi:hypothetical protein